MSNKNVSVNELSNVILEYLENFKDVTEEACKSGVIETADDAVKELRNAHPPGSGQFRSWDEYNKGWAKRTSTQKTKSGGIQAIVWNEKHYQLTHLLEKGHATRDGGRTQAFKHIAPVEQKCEEELLRNIKKNI